MNLYEELNYILDNICMDGDWGGTIVDAGWKITITNQDEDSDCYGTDIFWYVNFSAEKDGQLFSCFLNGTAQKEISYDRWVDTNCYIVEDYGIKRL